LYHQSTLSDTDRDQYSSLLHKTEDALLQLRVPQQEKEEHLAIVLQMVRLETALRTSDKQKRFSLEEGLKNLLQS